LGPKVLQLLPQAPQLSSSKAKALLGVQVPSHMIVPLGQAQVPLLQTWPSGHTLPQEPQLFASVLSLAQ
jgi:hypothetical protein